MITDTQTESQTQVTESILLGKGYYIGLHDYHFFGSRLVAPNSRDLDYLGDYHRSKIY